MTLDGLKNINDLFIVDERSRFFGGVDLKDIHARLAEAMLNDNVPENVKTVFYTSCNTMLYSWYTYRLSSPALLYLFSALELSLKTTFKSLGQNVERKTLMPLLKKAQNAGLISDDIFRDKFHGKIQMFVDGLHIIRNDLAHGSPFVVDQSLVLGFFYDISDIINHLHSSNTIQPGLS